MRNDIVVDIVTHVAAASSVDVFANATLNLRTHGKLIISKRHHGTTSQARNFVRRTSRHWRWRMVKLFIVDRRSQWTTSHAELFAIEKTSGDIDALSSIRKNKKRIDGKLTPMT